MQSGDTISLTKTIFEVQGGGLDCVECLPCGLE